MDPPVGLQEAQQAAWLKDKHFLQQLMDNTKVLPAYCTTHYYRILSARLHTMHPVQRIGSSTSPT